MSKAVIVLSGGLDSATCMGMAQKTHLELHAVHFQYGQKHRTEENAAREVARYYGATFQIIDLPEIFGGTGSSLIDDVEMPQSSYEELKESHGVSPTYVPYRNGNFLSMAATIALTEEASEVWAGMHAEDAHNWAYPDCTPEFLGAMAGAIYIGSYLKVRLVTPLQNMTKAEVVRKALHIGVPIKKTLSCYEGTVPACGVCPTCVGRIEAFRLNRVKDGISYRIPINWRL